MVSIIIPIYNVDAYLNSCLESIVKQTYTNWECVLINDGSTDSSGNICNFWAQKDNRIHVIHQKNSGVSIARNNGLQKAKGEYICFIDSDDWIDDDYLELMINHSNNCDFVVSGQIREFPDGKTIIYKPNNTGFFNLSHKQTKLFIELCKDYLLYAPHEKLYKKEIITNNNLRFLEGCNYGEDLIFNFQYLQYVKNISTVSVAKYHYRILPNTLSTKFRENQFQEDYNQWKILESFYREHNLFNQEAKEYLYRRLWGIVYDGIFIYPKLANKSSKFLKNILFIPEIYDLKNHQRIFNCSWWIKQAIIFRLYPIFKIYFWIKG